MYNFSSKLVCFTKLVFVTDNGEDTSLQQNPSIIYKLQIRNVIYSFRELDSVTVIKRLAYNGEWVNLFRKQSLYPTPKILSSLPEIDSMQLHGSDTILFYKHS